MCGVFASAIKEITYNNAIFTRAIQPYTPACNCPVIMGYKHIVFTHACSSFYAAYYFKRESPLRNPNVDVKVMRSRLAKDNYKDQFQGLLNLENRAHMKLLEEK